MTDDAKIAFVQTLVGNDATATATVCGVYLQLAADKMIRRLYPFDDTQTEIPSKYDHTQCELAARMFLRRGGEGELSHSENGIYRTYGSVNDEDILAALTPFAGVVG